MLLETDQAVVADPAFVETHLHLDVPRRRPERARQLTRETGVRIFRPVQEVVAAITLPRQRLKNGVVQSVGPHAASIEGNAFLTQAHHDFSQRFRIGVAQIRRSVRDQHHPVLSRGIELTTRVFRA